MPKLCPLTGTAVEVVHVPVQTPGVFVHEMEPEAARATVEARAKNFIVWICTVAALAMEGMQQARIILTAERILIRQLCIRPRISV
jgi:hypothetical protein